MLFLFLPSLSSASASSSVMHTCRFCYCKRIATSVIWKNCPEAYPPSGGLDCQWHIVKETYRMVCTWKHGSAGSYVSRHPGEYRHNSVLEECFCTFPLPWWMQRSHPFGCDHDDKIRQKELHSAHPTLLWYFLRPAGVLHPNVRLWRSWLHNKSHLICTGQSEVAHRLWFWQEPAKLHSSLQIRPTQRESAVAAARPSAKVTPWQIIPMMIHKIP